MNTSKYFAPDEFERCSPSCSIDDMDQGFLDVMDNIREKAGGPLTINSAYRSPEWDRSKGRCHFEFGEDDYRQGGSGLWDTAHRRRGNLCPHRYINQ